jgi:glycosyltransferase involved in cell wall biosynthesis
MKRIAFIVTSLNSGGVENYLLRFLKYSEGKIVPFVICKGDQFGELFNDYKNIKNIKLSNIEIGYINFMSLYRFYDFLKQNRIDAICDFTGNFAGLPLFIATIANIHNRIAFYRGSTNHFKEDKFRLAYNNLVKKMVERNATSILSNSQAALNFFFPNRNITDSKYQVIPNGIDSNDFCGEVINLRNELSIPVDAFVIGHVGRYNVAKNHDTIVEVAIRLCSSNTDIYFIFCGKGVDENLREVVSQARLERQIKLLGYRSDVNKVLNTIDVFYFPSLTEGQPNALIEAMVIGLPFVASNIDPILETVPSNLQKQLVAPKDADSAVSKLLDIYHSQNTSKYTCAEWAKEKYSAQSCFNLFMEKLN